MALFALLALSDVITPADVARKISARILEWSSAVKNPTILAVVTPQPVFRFKITNVERILVASQHGMEIARMDSGGASRPPTPVPACVR